MNDKFRPVAMALFVLAAIPPAIAGGGGMTGGATEMTQILNNVQLADSYAQQVMAYQNQLLQYETMLKNLLAHPNGVTAPNLSQLASNQAKIMAMGTDISSSMAQVDTNFATTFKNPTAASYAAKFNLWTNTSHDALRVAMLNAGLQREQFTDDATAVQALTTNVASSQGNLAALQALGGAECGSTAGVDETTGSDLAAADSSKHVPGGAGSEGTGQAGCADDTV